MLNSFCVRSAVETSGFDNRHRGMVVEARAAFAVTVQISAITIYVLFSVALRPNASYGLLILEVS